MTRKHTFKMLTTRIIEHSTCACTILASFIKADSFAHIKKCSFKDKGSVGKRIAANTDISII